MHFGQIGCLQVKEIWKPFQVWKTGNWKKRNLETLSSPSLETLSSGSWLKYQDNNNFAHTAIESHTIYIASRYINCWNKIPKVLIYPTTQTEHRYTDFA